MDFKKWVGKLVLGLGGMGLFLWMGWVLEPFCQAAGSQTPGTNASIVGLSPEDSEAIVQQLERDRRAQRRTKDLKTKLEQTNLELEQQKALAEINKLKKENMSSFDEPTISGQNNWPEIKVDYIGGNRKQKEAILSIGGTSYQVKERASPLANIEVQAISESAVTIHFNGPKGLTKTIEFKPQ